MERARGTDGFRGMARFEQAAADGAAGEPTEGPGASGRGRGSDGAPGMAVTVGGRSTGETNSQGAPSTDVEEARLACLRVGMTYLGTGTEGPPGRAVTGGGRPDV